MQRRSKDLRRCMHVSPLLLALHDSSYPRLLARLPKLACYDSQMPTRRPRRKAVLLLLGGLLGSLFLFAFFTTEHFAALGFKAHGERLLRMQQNPNFKAGKFHNPQPRETMVRGEQWQATKEWFGGKQQRFPPAPLPVVNATSELATPPKSGLRITWLGHSTTLIELDGARIVTDPHWSLRASPSMRVGPKRFHPPPLPLESLGQVDAVVISHDHYDHLDMTTVKRLGARGVRFVVPLGIGAHLEGWGIPASQITELSWWESFTLPSGVRIVSTPGQHFSGRLFPDGNPVLWSSYSLLGPAHRVFFSGDTGLAPELPSIGEKFGPFDVTLIEIGQYHRSWGSIHLGPHGALTAHQQVRGKRLLPIHWATFELAMHAWNEPPEELYAAAPALGVSLLTPRLGQPVEPDQSPLLPPWWREPLVH